MVFAPLDHLPEHGLVDLVPVCQLVALAGKGRCHRRSTPMSRSRTFGMGTGSSDSGVSSSMFLRRIDRSATARSGGTARVSLHDPLLRVPRVQTSDDYVPTLIAQPSELTRTRVSGSTAIFSESNRRV